MEQALQLLARAKVNLILRVVGRRPDGYHELQSLVHSVDLADTLVLAPLPEPGRVVLAGEGVPLAGRNSVWRAVKALAGAAGEWPLQTYDATALQGGADLFVEWMPQLEPGLAFDAAAIDDWRSAWAPVVARGEAGASVMAHRDYHAENLIRLHGRAGPAMVGLIDFQDAVKAHPAWDLHSLLQDARRDVSPALEALALDHYFALRPQVEREAFMRDYAGLAALNEARILGIFARLIVRDGKLRYRAFMPRMWRHLNANLDKPGLAPVRDWFARYVPEDSRR